MTYPPSAYCPREDARRVSFFGSSVAFRLSREIAPARHVDTAHSPSYTLFHEKKSFKIFRPSKC